MRPLSIRNLILRGVLVLVGALGMVLLGAVGFFYAVFYFPNRTTAVRATLKVAGEAREYLLYQPKGYDPSKPAPLVISLHPAMSWPSAEMALSGWNRLADEQGFLVVYPAGPGSGPHTWLMEGRTHPEAMPDVRFLSGLIDHLSAAYKVDPRRIYADGLSNGGGMAFALACARSERIAAVGMVSAARTLDWHWNPGCRPVPMIAFHGTADRIVPYLGGRTPVGPDVFPSVPDFTAGWAHWNGCIAPPQASMPAPGVRRLQYLDASGDARVVLVTLEGGGHQWPGGRPLPTFLVGPYSRDIDATREMWAFFRDHPLPSMEPHS